ncbi:MAG: YkvA family protein [Acidobacteriota bacterium]
MKMAKEKRRRTDKRLTRSEKSEMKGRMSSFLMFLPNMVKLLGGLLTDIRVPIAEKALFAAAIVYVISPIDFIPDVFPFIGQVDDLYVVALVLLRLVNRTDETVVREHWSGGGDIVALADSIAGLAPRFLPKRIARVLTSRVELAPAGQILRGITNKKEAVVLEIMQDDVDLESHSPLPN